MSQQQQGGPLLVNPLTLRVTSLRRPQLWLGNSQSIECAEEGDILFPSLKRAQMAADTCLAGGAHPILAFPASVGKHFVGEVFKAYLSFRNGATYPLSRLTFRVDLISPRGHRIPLFETEIPRLEALTNKDIRVETKDRLAEPGKFTLSVSANYTDISHEPKRFAMNYNIVVETAVCEASRNVVVLPTSTMALRDLQHHTVNGSDQNNPTPEGSDAALVAAKKLKHNAPPVFGVTIALKNISDTSMIISMVRFVPGENYELVQSEGSTALTTTATVSQFSANYSGGGREDFANAHIEGGDTRNYYFEVQQRTMFTRQSSSSSFGADLGRVHWEWRRENGDGGSTASEPFKLLQPKGILNEMMVTVPTAEPTVPIVGKPLTLTLRIVNNSPSKLDVALSIIVEKLLPFSVYAGPCVKPLGFIDAKGGVVEAQVTVVPLVCGVLTFQGAFEIVDARDARQKPLWPLPPPSVPPSLTHGAAAPTTTVQMSQPPPEEYPPVLMQLYVESSAEHLKDDE